MMEYDEIYTYLGAFGRYQKWMYFLLALTNFFAAFHNMSLVFLTAVPSHRCFVPELQSLNLSEETILNLSIPLEDKGNEKVRSQCTMFDRNFSGSTKDDVMHDLLLPGNRSMLPVIPCQNGWVYDKSIYSSTIVTLWDLVCDKKWLQATTTSIYMSGMLVGIFIFSNISDLFGRRKALLVAVVILIGVGIGLSFSPNYIVYVILRFLVGACNLSASTTAFVLIMEMIGPSRRMHLGFAFQYFWAFGYITVALIALFVRDFFHLQLAISVPFVVLLIPICVTSESPRWLYTQGKDTEAERILRKMAKYNKTSLPEKLNVTIKQDDHKANVLDLLRKPKLRWRSFNLFFNWFVNGLVYYGVSLSTSNLGGSPHVTFLISGAIEIPSYICSQVVLRYISMRWFQAIGMVIAGISLLVTLAVPKDLTTVIIVLSVIGKFFVAATFALIYVLSAELYPTVIRNVGVGTGSMFARIGSVIAPFIGQLGSVSMLIPMITFGVLSIISGLLVFLLPETKGTNLPETIDDVENIVRKNRSTTFKTEYGGINEGLT